MAAWYDPPTTPKPGLSSSCIRGLAFALPLSLLIAAAIAGMIILAHAIAPLLTAL
jgi:hypothetical protein